MQSVLSTPFTPKYRGKSWINVRLPRKSKDWLTGGDKSIAKDCTSLKSLGVKLDQLNKEKAWVFPKNKTFFFSDLHGDPEAFANSLVASGSVKKTGPGDLDFQLLEEPKKSNFVIGGDCFDKGPSSLNLIRGIFQLKKQGARVRVLAGNHDVRVYFGMTSVGLDKDVSNEHFFIRTGQKIIPLLKEIWDEYLDGKIDDKDLPSRKKCRNALFPRESWFEDFPKFAEGKLRPKQIEREISRIRKKTDNFEKKCAQAGMSLNQVYGAVQKWQELFLHKEGEFYWFFRRMRLAYSSGSFLFIHAGIDNVIAKDMAENGVREMNRHFRTFMKGNPFDFYYSPLCNTIRTKYRNVDHLLTKKGALNLKLAGISAIIHGHRNLRFGQRIAIRNSVLNFECDVSLDSHTRKTEKIRGRGAAVTIIDPKGYVHGISTDYPFVKTFHPKETLKKLNQFIQKKRASS